MSDPAAPEAGERFRPITHREVIAAGGGAILGGAADVIRTIYVSPDGLTTGERDDMIAQANDRLDSFQAVAHVARNSNGSNAPAALRFTSNQIKKTKQEIVTVSGKDTIDTTQDHVDAFAGWGILAGTVAVTAITHAVRRWRFSGRNK